MYQTIQLSSRVSVQGEIVERLPDGQVVVRDGLNTYRGQPIAPMVAARDALHRLGAIQADAR